MGRSDRSVGRWNEFDTIVDIRMIEHGRIVV